MSTVSELLIRRTVFGGRGRFRIPSMPLTAEFQFVTSLSDSLRRDHNVAGCCTLCC